MAEIEMPQRDHKISWLESLSVLHQLTSDSNSTFFLIDFLSSESILSGFVGTLFDDSSVYHYHLIHSNTIQKHNPKIKHSISLL